MKGRKGIGPKQLGSPLKLDKGKKRGKKQRKDYSLDSTFNEYDVMKESFKDTYQPTDTIFKSFGLDGGTSAEHGQMEARYAAEKMSGVDPYKGYTSRFLQPNDRVQYRTTDQYGNTGITTLTKYDKKDLVKSVVK